MGSGWLWNTFLFVINIQSCHLQDIKDEALMNGPLDTDWGEKNHKTMKNNYLTTMWYLPSNQLPSLHRF